MTVYSSELSFCLLFYLPTAVLGVYIHDSDSAKQLPYLPETLRRYSLNKGVPVPFSFSIPIQGSLSSPTIAPPKCEHSHHVYNQGKRPSSFIDNE